PLALISGFALLVWIVMGIIFTLLVIDQVILTPITNNDSDEPIVGYYFFVKGKDGNAVKKFVPVEYSHSFYLEFENRYKNLQITEEEFNEWKDGVLGKTEKMPETETIGEEI